MGLRRRIEQAAAAKGTRPETPQEEIRRAARERLRQYRAEGSPRGPWGAAAIEAWILASDEELAEVLDCLEGYSADDRKAPSAEDDDRYFRLREAMLSRVSPAAARHNYTVYRCLLVRELDRLSSEWEERGVGPGEGPAYSRLSSTAVNRRTVVTTHGGDPILDADEARRRAALIASGEAGPDEIRTLIEWG